MDRQLVWRRLALVLTACLCVTVSTPTHAEIILLDEDFDAENGGAPALNYTTFANFTVTSGAVDLIGNGQFDFFPGNGLYVDLDGTTNAAGTLASETFNLQPGLVYTLEFDLGNSDDQFGGGSFDNTMLLSVGSVISETFNRTELTPFQTITRQFSVTAPETAQVIFAHEGGDNLGLLIDNVRLTVVPEPASLVLLLATIAGLRRRV